MISSLKGEILNVGNNFVEVEVGGVGYEIKFKVEGLKLKVGQEVSIPIQTVVSENEVSLFGFENREEKAIFNLLRSVGGVGPKTAAAIIWQSQSEEIIKAIGEANVSFFEKIKGIGKKTAQRVIIDLKSKVGGLGELNLKEENIRDDDLYLSLKQLGFDRKEIEKVMVKLPAELVTIEKKLEWCLSKI